MPVATEVYHRAMVRTSLRALLASFLVAASIAIAATSLWGAPPASASGYSLDGTWTCCGAGGASPQLWAINGPGGVLEYLTGQPFGTFTISLNGNSVAMFQTYNSSFGGYTAEFHGTLSSDGRTMSGPWTSNAGQSGTLTATRNGPVHLVNQSTGNVEPLAATIGTPGQIFHSMSHNIQNAAIAVVLMLGLTFPSTIFNQTFSAHYDEIMAILKRRRDRLAALLGIKRRDSESPPVQESELTSTTEVSDEPNATAAPWFFGVLMIGAILGAMLSPHFGVNIATVVAFISTLAAFALGTLISWYVSRTFRRLRGYRLVSYRKALPLGLVIAALCVVISRISSFEPGYLYGIVVGVAFAETMNERHNAHLTAIGSVATMAVALVSWILWIPVNHLALEHTGFIPLAVIDNVLGSLFIGGLVGTTIGLLPLVLLPGRTLMSWRKDAWAVLFFIALFLLIEVELRPESGPASASNAPWVTAIFLFLLFGGGTIAMRRYFAARTPTDAAEPTIATSETT
jgi:hypothetical protein